MKPRALPIALIFFSLFSVNYASAEMVDIGMGKMPQSEFTVLKARVQGRSISSRPTITTSIVRTERYGMAEMTADEFKALRDQVAGRKTITASTPKQPPTQMIDIGTGKMDANEFQALKCLVEKSDVLACHGLFAKQP